MKYLVIWFILTSAHGNFDGYTDYMYSPVFEKIDNDTGHRTNQNFILVDTFEEAKKIATEKSKFAILGQIKVFIYEVGKKYSVIAREYKTTELQEVTKVNIEIVAVK